MSVIGYNGRAFKILRGNEVIAAVRTKSAAHNREPVDVTTDDSNGHRTLLPEPGVRSIDVTIEGVATSENYQWMLNQWNGNTLTDIAIQNADGSIEVADHGFFLGSLEFSGESAGDVAFSATFMSSGEVTVLES